MRICTASQPQTDHMIEQSRPFTAEKNVQRRAVTVLYARIFAGLPQRCNCGKLCEVGAAPFLLPL